MLAVALALVSCSQPKAAVPAPAYPALGTVVKLGDGEVRATGVVARYPVAGMGAIYARWALYSSLGSETTSLGVIAMLEVRPGDDPHYGLSRDATIGALAAFDGKLVTVEGTMTPARVSFGRGSSPWPQLSLSSIATAPPEAQARVVWKGALVQPGMWFDEPWRYNLAHAYETLRTGLDSYYDLARAEKVFGSPIPTPKSPLAGRLVGVTLATYPRDSNRSWRLAYSSGLFIDGPLKGTARQGGTFGALGADWIASTLKVKSSSNDRPVDVNGHPGLIGEMNGIGPAMTHYIFFWDGQEVVGIEYEGLGPGPSEKDLVAIAASMSK